MGVAGQIGDNGVNGIDGGALQPLSYLYTRSPLLPLPCPRVPLSLYPVPVPLYPVTPLPLILE